MQILWQVQCFVDLEVQTLWQAQSFVDLTVQISWPAQYFVDLEVQTLWHVQYFVDLEVQTLRQTPLWTLKWRFVAGAANVKHLVGPARSKSVLAVPFWMLPFLL